METWQADEYSRLQNIIANRGTPEKERKEAALALRNLWNSVQVNYATPVRKKGGGKRRKKSKRRKSKKRKTRRRKSKRRS